MSHHHCGALLFLLRSEVFSFSSFHSSKRGMQLGRGSEVGRMIGIAPDHRGYLKAANRSHLFH